MPFNVILAKRIEKLIQKNPRISQKKMFGGLCFLYNGKMCFGVEKKHLVVRVKKDDQDALLKLKHTRPMDFTGKALRGFLYIEPPGFKDTKMLKKWVQYSLKYVKSSFKKK